MKTGKYSFKRGIIALHFAGKKCKLPFTYFEESVADSLYKFHSRASLSLYYRSPDGVAIPSGLSAEAENDVIAAI